MQPLVAAGIVLLLTSSSLACSKEGATPVGASAASQVSSDNLFASIHAAMSSSAVLDPLRAGSLLDYYDNLAKAASTDSLAIDQQSFAGIDAEFAASRSAIVSLGHVFSSLGELWQVVGFNPATYTKADFVTGLQGLSDMQAGRGIFAPATKGLALATSDGSASGSCSTGQQSSTGSVDSSTGSSPGYDPCAGRTRVYSAILGFNVGNWYPTTDKDVYDMTQASDRATGSVGKTAASLYQNQAFLDYLVECRQVSPDALPGRPTTAPPPPAAQYSVSKLFDYVDGCMDN